MKLVQLDFRIFVLQSDRTGQTKLESPPGRQSEVTGNFKVRFSHSPIVQQIYIKLSDLSIIVMKVIIFVANLLVSNGILGGIFERP